MLNNGVMSTHQQQSRQLSDSERVPAILAHLATIIAMFVSAGWLSFVGPLVVWFMYKDRSEYVRRAAAGSFNFNIWAWVMTIIGWIMIFTVILLPVGILLLTIAFLMTIICHTLGAIRAANGEPFRYPAQIKILT